jgi:hypothetical protein
VVAVVVNITEVVAMVVEAFIQVVAVVEDITDLVAVVV